MNKELREKLEAKFPIKDIQFRIGARDATKTKGIALAYIDARACMNRLDEVFASWSTEYKPLIGSDKVLGFICKLTCVDERGNVYTREDGANTTDMEAIKGGISDAFKRACAAFGIGRYLYEFPDTWVPLKNEKYFAETPVVPNDFRIDSEKSSSPTKSTPVKETPKTENKPTAKASPPKETPKTTSVSSEKKCTGCGANISDKVAKFSKDKFGQELCIKCQKNPPVVEEEIELSDEVPF